MLLRVATAAALICLAGSAFAADDKAAETECIEQLTKTEALIYQKIKSKALTEKQAEETARHLDEADQACWDGDFDDARASLDSATGVLTQPEE